MPRKPGLSLQQHIELGAELAALSSAVQNRAIAVANAYGKTTKQARELMKATDAIDSARALLDSALCNEYWDEFKPEVYYPGDPRPVVEFR